MQVLIAEDSSVERIMLQRFVQQLGHECILAEDGTQAWELFQAHQPDVLISDWMMPGLDGPELCRRVRAYPDAPYTYVVLLTVLDDQEHTRHGMHAGADDYLAKPLQFESLERPLIAAERVRHLHRQLWHRDNQREHAHQALLRLAQQVAGTGGAEQLFATLVSEGTALVDGSAGIASTLQGAESRPVTVHSTIDPQMDPAIRAAQLVSTRSLERRAPSILNGSSRRAPGEAPSPAALAVPLLHDDRVLGTLAIVGVSAGKRFTPDDAQLLLRLASIGATGLVGLRRAANVNPIHQQSPSRVNALPLPPTVLIGRDEEVARLCAELALPESRLLTVTGPPGVGKSRLAVEAARQITPDAVFVDLTAISQTSGAIAAICESLGLGSQSGLEGLESAIGGRDVLLVLDGLEHLLEAANIIGQILINCPSLKILATSRMQLRLRGEQAFPISPLATPALATRHDVPTVLSSPAVALFVERARAALPAFTVDEANAPAVAEICARLDGLPLAVELAAARCKLVPPDALLTLLDRQLDLLTGDERDRAPRHQSMRAAIDWSYRLLDADQQRAFRCLAVFTAGFALEAVGAVANLDQERSLEMVAGLLDRGLVDQSRSSLHTPRFRALGPIGAYAREQLDASGELETVQRRHCQFFSTLAERFAAELYGPRQAEALEHLAVEYPNLRAALAIATASADLGAAARLAGTLAVVRKLRGQSIETEHWLDRLLPLFEASSPSAAAAKALSCATRLAIANRDWEMASRFAEASLAQWRRLENNTGTGEALADLAVIRVEQGSHAKEARELAREGASLVEIGRDPWARAHLGYSLGVVARAHANHRAARRHLLESARLWAEIGDQWSLALCLDELSVVAAAENRIELPVGLSGSARHLRQSLGARLAPARQEWLDRRLAPACTALGDERVAAIVAESQARGPVELLAALDEPAQPTKCDWQTGDEGVPFLSPRERQVTALVALGLRNYQIGERLGITRHTAEIHVGKILSKLEMGSRAQLAAWAVAHGLVQL
jgi:predicted ATPase/DNA-binding NarL/FixJ family response regulator